MRSSDSEGALKVISKGVAPLAFFDLSIYSEGIRERVGFIPI